MTDHLHPTPNRLRIVADAEAGRLPLILSQREVEVLDAGWIQLAASKKRWEATPLGRAIRTVRILDREDGKHIVAESGDPDEPRVLGEAWREAGRWLVRVDDGGWYAAVNTVHQAREQLRHMAATALAADPADPADPAYTVQQGQTQVLSPEDLNDLEATH